MVDRRIELLRADNFIAAAGLPFSPWQYDEETGSYSLHSGGELLLVVVTRHAVAGAIDPADLLLQMTRGVIKAGAVNL